MKRILTLLVFVMAMVLIGCTKDTDSTNTTTNSTTTSTTVEIGNAVLKGISDVTVNLGGTFDPKAGVTAEDYNGTNLTAQITITGTVDLTTPGSYKLTYTVTGTSGNNVTKDRYVSVVSLAPVITVNPDVMDIYQGDELDLLLGVTVADDLDLDLVATIKDDGGFDKDVIGTYTITYEATDSEGHVATATRTVNVLEVLMGYVVEVQNAFDANWGSKLLPVSGVNVISISDNYDLGDPKQITIIINTSENAITVTTSDKYGEAAIIDKNGFVKEGRDGANGKLVNANYPLRTSGAQLDPNAYGVDMIIPSGGFLLIAPNEGGTFDTDGRSFIAKNVIYQYDSVVSIYNEDKSTILTQYVDNAPTVLNLTKLEIIEGTPASEFNILAGLKVKDDNGTFDTSDDIEISIDNVVTQADPNFNLTVAGTYTFMLAVQDANGNNTVVQRQVIIHPAVPSEPTLDINRQRFVIDPSIINPTTINTTNVNIFTPDFSGTLSELVVKWGVVVVVDETGKIIVVRDPYGKQFTVENPEGVAAVGWDAQNMLAGLENPTKGYVMVFPNGSGSRTFALSHARTIGAQVTLYHTYLVPTMLTNGKTYSFSLSNVNPTAINTKAVNIFTSDYTGDLSQFTLGYGVVVILDAEGKVVLVRDAANGRQYDVNNPTVPSALTATDAGWSVGNMLAGITLTGEGAIVPAGGMVMVFPNDGVNGATSPRTFALSNLRAYGREVTFFQFE